MDTTGLGRGDDPRQYENLIKGPEFVALDNCSDDESDEKVSGETSSPVYLEQYRVLLPMSFFTSYKRSLPVHRLVYHDIAIGVALRCQQCSERSCSGTCVKTKEAPEAGQAVEEMDVTSDDYFVVTQDLQSMRRARTVPEKTKTEISARFRMATTLALPGDYSTELHIPIQQTWITDFIGARDIFRGTFQFNPILNQPVSTLVWIFKTESGYLESFERATFFINNQPVFSMTSDELSTHHLRQVGLRTPPSYEDGTRPVPFFLYHFGLDASKNTPLGSVNFSRIDQARLEVTLGSEHKHVKELKMMLMYRCCNFFRITSGMGGTLK
jgi:hypothetical protein